MSHTFENSEKQAPAVTNDDSVSNAFANEVYGNTDRSHGGTDKSHGDTDKSHGGTDMSHGGGNDSSGGGRRGSRHYIEQFPLHIDRPSSYIQAQGEVRKGVSFRSPCHQISKALVTN